MREARSAAVKSGGGLLTPIRRRTADSLTKNRPGLPGGFWKMVKMESPESGAQSTGDDPIEAGLEILLGLQTHGLLDHLTALEEQQGGDGSDAELTG